MADRVVLRELISSDLDVFFEHQLDEEANWMAAFTSPSPADRDAFFAHWSRITADPSTMMRTVLVNDMVAGHVFKYENEGAPEVSYWIGRESWGRGVATEALRRFLAEFSVRPVFARVAFDNTASLRVLEKNGFRVTGRGHGFANARKGEIDELFLRLDASKPQS